MPVQEFQIASEAELANPATALIDACKEHKVVTFYGEMGAGKTTFIKVICELLGTAEATSPTFAIINEYRSAEDEPVYHFDFYRIKDEQEAFDLGYEDYFYSGYFCFIEWPEKIANLLPQDHVKVRIGANESQRNILIES